MNRLGTESGRLVATMFHVCCRNADGGRTVCYGLEQRGGDRSEWWNLQESKESIGKDKHIWRRIYSRHLDL